MGRPKRFSFRKRALLGVYQSTFLSAYYLNPNFFIRYHEEPKRLVHPIPLN